VTPLINLTLFSYNFWVEPFSSASAFIVVGLRICYGDRQHFNKDFTPYIILQSNNRISLILSREGNTKVKSEQSSFKNLK
jgi:hypothetical protein